MLGAPDQRLDSPLPAAKYESANGRISTTSIIIPVRAVPLCGVLDKEDEHVGCYLPWGIRGLHSNLVVSTYLRYVDHRVHLQEGTAVEIT